MPIEKFCPNPPSPNDDDLIDAYHEGWRASRLGGALPYDPGRLADAWKEGRNNARRALRVRAVTPSRPEGYFHSKLPEPGDGI